MLAALSIPTAIVNAATSDTVPITSSRICLDFFIVNSWSPKDRKPMSPFAAGSPVCFHAMHQAKVRRRDEQHRVLRKVFRLHHAFARMAQHPLKRADHPRSRLQRCRNVVGRWLGGARMRKRRTISVRAAVKHEQRARFAIAIPQRVPHQGFTTQHREAHGRPLLQRCACLLAEMVRIEHRRPLREAAITVAHANDVYLPGLKPRKMAKQQRRQALTDAPVSND